MATPHQGSLSSQQMETITEKHNCTQCGNQQVVGRPACTSEGSGRTVKAKYHEVCCETAFLEMAA